MVASFSGFGTIVTHILTAWLSSSLHAMQATYDFNRNEKSNKSNDAGEIGPAL